MNDENLRKGERTRFTKENASEKGKAGGVASGKKRRDKKLLKDCLEILLERKITAKDGTVMTGAEAISAKVFQLALKGDLRAFEIIRDTTGQKPKEKLVVNEVDAEMIKMVEEMVRGINDEN